MSLIRKLNKLWSNESIHYMDVLLIPVLEDVACVADTSAASASASVPNGTRPLVDRRRSSATKNSCKAEPKPRAGSEAEASVDISVSDMFNRIDRDIKQTASNLQRLERNST